MDHRFLFFSKGKTVGTAIFDWFGIGPGTFPRVERREDNAAVFSIEESHGIALIATDFLEGIEAHDG